MFRLPDAKRVRREELYDSSSDDEHASLHGEDNAAARAKLNAHLASLLRFDSAPRDSPAAGPTASAPERDGQTAQGGGGGDGGKPELSDPEQEFEFRLFASDAPVAPKVVLESKTAVSADDAAMVSLVKRPLSYYIAAEPTAEERAMFLASAVSGEDILRSSAQRTWGMEMPWRVTKLTLARKQIQRLVAHLPDGSLLPAKLAGDASDESQASAKKTRKRPGKKRRITLRTKDKALKAKQEAELKSKISKEEHLREKKKRLNAQRRGKRRQKEKEKKAAAKSEPEEAPGQAMSVDSDGGDDSV